MAAKVALPLRSLSPKTTLLPFLYGTYTLQKVLSNCSSKSSCQSRRASTRTPEKTALYRLLASESDNTIPQVELSPPPGPRRRRDSTITFAEQKTFTRIFNDIIASSAKGSDDKLLNNQTSSLSPNAKGRGRHDDSIGSILADAAKASKSRPAKSMVTVDHSSFRPREQEAPALGRSERIRQAIERYPPSLRVAAARALFAQRQQVEEAQVLNDNQEKKVGVVDTQLDFVRHRELLRVEDMLKAAKTDMDVWKILEDEVFSTIKKLNTELGEPDVKTARKVRKPAKGKKKDSAKATEGLEAENVAQDKEASSLSIIGPNYPAHLLVAARLFRHEFPTSPLALALLPAIKKHGPISYVLGASTALYNELIHVLWNTYNDYNGIDELLKDMDKGGVEFDEATYNLLEAIQKEKRDIRSGHQGRTLEALWKMQAMTNSLNILGEWRKVIKARLREMEMTTDDVEDVDDEDSLDMA